MAEQLRQGMSPAGSESLKHTIQENRTSIMIFGIIMTLIGVVALVYPLTTAIVVKIMIGWVLLIAGLSQIIFSFSTTRWTDFFLELLIGILFAIVGIWLAFFPLTGILTLTLLLAFTFIIQGALGIVSSFRMRPHEGWGWVLFAGILGVVIGLMILGGFPSSAAWAIGLLVGINLIASGVAYIALAMSARRYEEQIGMGQRT
jgi:uncharacterized membrane protein HdeD (DUF308 family)